MSGRQIDPITEKFVGAVLVIGVETRSGTRRTSPSELVTQSQMATHPAWKGMRERQGLEGEMERGFLAYGNPFGRGHISADALISAFETQGLKLVPSSGAAGDLNAAVTRMAEFIGARATTEKEFATMGQILPKDVIDALTHAGLRYELTS